MAADQWFLVLEGAGQRRYRRAVRDIAQGDAGIAKQPRPSGPPDRAVPKPCAEAVVVQCEQFFEPGSCLDRRTEGPQRLGVGCGRARAHVDRADLLTAGSASDPV